MRMVCTTGLYNGCTVSLILIHDSMSDGGQGVDRALEWSSWKEGGRGVVSMGDTGLWMPYPGSWLGTF